MNKRDWTLPTAIVLAALAGLAVGLLLPYADTFGGVELIAGAPTEAVAVFSEQGQTSASFLIATVQPEETVAASQSRQPEQPTGQAPAATPQPDASAFSITPVSMAQKASAGRILIYHTHTYEAYEQTEPLYQETEKWRTADEGYNMIRVGEELALLLRGLGYEVVHDTTAFEPPDLNSAYARSLDMLEQRAAAGETFDLYIDLHRDAYVEGQAGENTLSVGGVEIARLMLLIGKGEGYSDAGEDQKPDWQTNLLRAQGITDALNDQLPGMCKEVRLKSGRFNQHVASSCVLIEVGNNRNTLGEALAAMPYLADAIDASMGK